MKKRSFDGGVASVRVIPMGMKDGGDLSVPPPKQASLNLNSFIYVKKKS